MFLQSFVVKRCPKNCREKVEVTSQQITTKHKKLGTEPPISTYKHLQYMLETASEFPHEPAFLRRNFI